MSENTITISATISAPIEKVWEYYTQPEHIMQWAFASDDWEAPHAENDLKVDGRFLTRMEAKDKSEGFDFTGTYTQVKEHELIAYTMDGEDQRKVVVTFVPKDGGVEVVTTFDMEHENSRELQQAGWQGILENFKKHVESA